MFQMFVSMEPKHTTRSQIAFAKVPLGAAGKTAVLTEGVPNDLCGRRSLRPAQGLTQETVKLPPCFMTA